MKISIYTIARNCMYFDFHVEAMLRHHLPLVDEIIVNEGYSDDDTYDRISVIDPKIKIFREKWDIGSKSETMYAKFKNHAREQCSGDWCILVDCDELIPEWEFERIRTELQRAAKPIIPMRYVNFYGNYRVYSANPQRVKWPAIKYPIHRNDPQMHVWGDGSNVELLGQGDDAIDTTLWFECHHMGFVRSPARLRQKWRIMHKLKQTVPTRDRMPGFVYDLVPHDWLDPDFLEDLRIYEGPFAKAVRDDPDEFVRDDLKLFEYLKSRQEQAG
jgi:glycosyltransferase involved in cell wall biosynthesis